MRPLLYLPRHAHHKERTSADRYDCAGAREKADRLLARCRSAPFPSFPIAAIAAIAAHNHTAPVPACVAVFRCPDAARIVTMGAHYLFALDLLAPFLPPDKDSKRDIALLRAANLASRRQREDIEDRFVFLVYGACDQESVKQAMCSYGFPGCEVRFVAEDEDLTPDENGRITLTEDYDEAIGDDLGRWVTQHHPGSLPLGGILTTDQEELASYREIEWWWIGYEATGGAREWPFDPDRFSQLLPAPHWKRGDAWLEILAKGLALEDMERGDLPYESFQIQVKAAALCEWLHGFDAASGNGFNDFDPPDVALALDMDRLFIGYQAAEALSRSDRSPPDECADIDEALQEAVLALTEEARTDVLSALGVMGGDGLLFWTLYASIWPRYDCCLDEAINGLLGLESVEYGEIDAAWQFVQDGWHESADP